MKSGIAEKTMAIVLGVLSLSLIALADENKTRLTFLDTLNKGKELSIAADFAQPAAPAAAKTTGAPPDSVAANSKTALKHEAGVVVSRFRIQVLASTREEQVKRERATLASKIDVPVSISFESPYYKLFTGEFKERSEAESYLVQVKKLGYNDAWISRTAVSPK